MKRRLNYGDQLVLETIVLYGVILVGWVIRKLVELVMETRHG